MTKTTFPTQTITRKREHRFRSAYANHAYGSEYALWDIPLFESEDFLAIPTLGSLVPGWLLVVPKTYAISFGALSAHNHRNLRVFIRNILPQLELRFGPIAAFEHGPSQTRSAAGCGVDYAHMHLVPTTCDLHAGATIAAPDISWAPVPSIASSQAFFRRDQEYLYLEQRVGRTQPLLGTAKQLPSQLFRKVIARHLNRADQFDWKTHPEMANISITIVSLSEPPASAPTRRTVL